MAKDPAFLFYSKDFLSGISDLTMEERGQYITLLCLQHQKGHLSDKLIRLTLGNATADVMAKFRQDSAGLWYNARLEEEAEKRKAHGEKQKERAVQGWKKRKGEATANATALPLVSANASVDENGILLNYKEWTQQVLEENDQVFEGMLHNEKTMKLTGLVFDTLAKDHLGLLNRYPKMRPQTQQSFRESLMKHIRENFNKANGNGRKPNQRTADTVIESGKDFGSFK